MQAIVVKYLGPTNARGSRYKATAQAGSVTIEADDRLNEEDNAKAACEKFREKFGWTKEHARGYAGPWVMGWLPDGCAVFVNSSFQ